MRIRPWMVAIALALAGAAGGVGVYVAGSRISQADRVAIVAWERAAAEAAGEPRAWLDRLPTMSRSQLPEARAAFTAGSRALDTLETPEIMRRTARALAEFFAVSSSVLDQIRDPATSVEDVEAAIERALAAYGRARDALVRLRCRARLADCERTLL